MYCSARARAARRVSVLGLAMSRSTASAIDSASGVPHSPQVPSTSSRAPPNAAVTTGVPEANASSTARPKVSTGHTDNDTSADASARATASRPSRYPSKLIGASPAMPWISSRSGPVPKTFICTGRPRSYSSTAAATASCGLFSRDMRPTWMSLRVPSSAGWPTSGWKVSRSTPSGTRTSRACVLANSSAAYCEVTTTASNDCARRRLRAPTTVSTPNRRRTQPLSMPSRRSWLNSTEPIPRLRAHRAAGDSVHLSETSTDVGLKRASASSARHGWAIMR